jgi:branched-chain amino acid transport system ATP-binding protein
MDERLNRLAVRPENVLECRGVTKRFGALTAVDNVDFNVSRGETVGIGGPNGAGKTTFFDLISGLTSMTEGSIAFMDQNIAGSTPHHLFHKGLARTFQLNSGFDDLSVYENVLAAQVFGRHSSKGRFLTHKEDKDAALALLADFGLEDISDDKVAGVPILARKKLMVATALVNNPQILLLDEPVGGLTPPEIDEFIELIIRLKIQGLTLVFIEHVMYFLMSVANRAIIMHQGQIIYDGEPQGLSSDKTVSEVYLGTARVGVAS